MRCLILLGLIVPYGIAQEGSLDVRQAIFSPKQLFWPHLAETGMQGDAKPETAKPGRAKPKAGKADGAAPGREIPPGIGVLPVTVRDYRESLQCDSCHRLSPNGMEFFLENYFKDRLATRFPGTRVELVAPHFPLLQSGKINLAHYLDSLHWPWTRWLAGDATPLVYRPRDWMTEPAVRKRMDKLGGQLGLTHLLLCSQVKVSVFPKSSITHEGGLEWGFRLVFWDVAGGRPEWALTYSEAIPHMDLDKSLESNLDRGLVPVWDSLPGQLQALWKAEPR